MRVVEERSRWLQIVAVFGGFFIGPFVALRVAMRLVPESDLVQTIGVLAFAAVFAGGAAIWLGLGLAAVVVRFFASLVRGRPPAPEALGSNDRLVPPGYRAFVVLGLGAGLAVGVLAGVATELSLPVATATWTLLGLGYGLLLWAAAHHGYLPFDPE
jgi:hypothetical protein